MTDDRQALLEEAAFILEQEGWLLGRLKHEGRSGSRVNQFADRQQAWLDRVRAYRAQNPGVWPEPPDNS